MTFTTRTRNIMIAVSAALLSLVAFWAPFLVHAGQFWGMDFKHTGMNTIVQNFDGLNFLVVAKSWYNPQIITDINHQFLTGNEPIYFSAHYPFFAAVIWIFSLFLSLPTALLAAIILGNILLAYALYTFFETYLTRPRLALILALLAMFFPARILSVRAVGSNETYFLVFVLLSLTAAYRSRHLPAALWGALAVVTRSPGILLFAGYGLAALSSYRFNFRKILSVGWPYFAMPLTLLGLFGFYGMRYGSFLAYFQSGDNIHLFFPPFEIFSTGQTWITDMWREDILYLYVFYGTGISLYLTRIRKHCGLDALAAAGYGVLYGLVLLFIAHRDLARYALPVAPIAYLGFAPSLDSLPRRAYLALGILLIPIFLFGWQFVLGNVQPINDWSVFL